MRSRRFLLSTSTSISSALPSSYNDGPLWTGKGLTQSIHARFEHTSGPLSITLGPVAFWAQNLAFALEPNGLDSARSFASPISGIDMPQRFGPQSVSAVDPGQSTIQLTLLGASAGVSTANEVWGPAFESPLILGTNAPGIPRVFVGTANAVQTWPGAFEARFLWGRSTSSHYVTGVRGGRRKYVTGAVGQYTPRGVPNLSLGAARFFHLSADEGFPPGFFTRVFQGLVQTSLATAENPIGDDPTDNQLASVFFRWAFPGSGFEVFGELGREDTSYDWRDLVMQLYHDAAYVVGLQRVWKSNEAARYVVFRGEVLNTRIGPLYQASPQTAWYTHDVKGHTERGQVLGAPFAPGGGSTLFSVTRYTDQGSTRVRAGRGMLREVLTPSGGAIPDRAAVLALIEVERMKFGTGHGPDLTSLVRVEWLRNRAGGPSVNVTTTFSATLTR
jgi:hypothetical protein